MTKRKLNVAMIGYDFMGRAHSNAWRQVAHFFPDAAAEPVLKVVVGRTEAKLKEAALASLGAEVDETAEAPTTRSTSLGARKPRPRMVRS